jgi:hypothetical protein
MRRQFTKSLYSDLGGESASVPMTPLSSGRRCIQVARTSRPTIRPRSVPESMMGMKSPSHSNKGSFGPKTRTSSRCPTRVVFPGPGHYENKYAMVVVNCLRKV